MPGKAPHFSRPLALLLLAALSGCGGGDDGGTPPDGNNPPADSTAPALSIDFPPSGSLVDQVSTPALTVRGTASDDVNLKEVRINGVDVKTSDGFSTWEADVPLAPGSNLIAVTALDEAGNTVTADVTVENTAYLPRLSTTMASGPSESIVYVVDTLRDALFTFDRKDGAMTLLSEEGGEPRMSNPLDVEMLSDRTLLVADSEANALFKVDLDDGSRSLVSGESKGEGPMFGYPLGIGWNPLAPQTAYVSDLDKAVFEVDLATGDRRIVSAVNPDRDPDTDDDIGTGETMVSPRDVVNDIAHGRLLVVDSSRRRILAVDPGTGDRSVFAAELPQGSLNLVLDGAANRVLLATGGADGMLGSVDLELGEFMLLSGSGQGNGPALTFPTSVTLPDEKGTVLVSTDVGMFEVDLATGDRERLPGPKTGSGDAFTLPYGISCAPAGDRLYFGDWYDKPLRVLAMDIKDRERTLISEAGVRGEGGTQTHLADLEIDAAAATLWVTAGTVVMSIDIESGDRKVISGGDVGSGPEFSGFPEGITLDEPANRVLVLDRGIGHPSTLFAVNMADGNREIISGGEVGEGPELGSVVGIAMSPDAGYVLATGGHGTESPDDDRIYRVNLATGEREVLASLPSDGLAVAFGADPEQAFVLTEYGLFTVDVETGELNLLSGRASENDALVGRGPMENAGRWVSSHLAYDEDRDVIYLAAAAPHAIIAIDPASGDRVIVAN